MARMCRAHPGNTLTYFVPRLTNGPMEGLNNQIQGLIKKAYGYRNKERFKADTFFTWVDWTFIPLNEKLPEHS